MGTIANGKAYVITYNAEVDEYPKHLPIVQEMINSFQFLPSTSAVEIQQKQQENTIFGENATLANNATGTPTTTTVTNQTAVPSSSSFVNYENSTYGIRMQYPSDWEKQEDVAGGSVHFLSPLENGMDMFREGLGIMVQSIPSANTLDNFTDISLSSLQRAAPSPQIMNTSQTTLANSIPAEIVEFTWVNPQNNNQMKTMDVYAIADGKGYIISYGALVSKYDLYLPTIQHMLDSFEVLPLG